MADFALTLVSAYDVDAVLEDLTTTLVEVLDLAGSGVALAGQNQLRFATAYPQQVVALEQVQHRHQAGPCVDAFHRGEIVAVSDLTARTREWPEYCRVADLLGVVAVAGIPMRLTDQSVGALNLYAHQPRDWTAEDLAMATVMANMATIYLTNASEILRHEQLNEQLHQALASRAIIEQAKGAVATTHQISVEKAFERIRRHARAHQVSVRAVSEAIVNLGTRI